MVERECFYGLGDHAAAQAKNGETVLLNLRAENSDFIRFNQTRVRQAGRVRQARLRASLVCDGRQASASFDLSGSENADRLRLESALAGLRQERAILPLDPYLDFSTAVNDTERTEPAALPGAGEATADIVEAFDGMDMTGIWACGDLCSGFANSLGQRNWHAVGSFNFDWSVHDGAQSVKQSLAGQSFHREALRAAAAEAKHRLSLLSRPPRRLTPGRYRAYLAPEAMVEILGLLSWGGFGLRSQRTGRSPLMRLADGEVHLDHRVSIVENVASGFAPSFTGEGFIRPDRVPLIDGGRFASCLVDARSGREFDQSVNASVEAPLSLEMAPGALAEEDVFSALDTGIYVSNVWYLNFSDRNACRITGMTRFACLWVEDGVPRGPIEPMRFDDTLYGLLGERLLALSQERPLSLDPDTYEGRSYCSARLPGALVEGLNLAL
ncbi:MAG TPA: metallopeptidase TldD-related protein [Gammaproteobacteria bacterium]|nr:metallopeptidase TldD-related protein [Gammaproteobacteria bacterium]